METSLICLLKPFLYKRQIKEANGAQRKHKCEAKDKMQLAMSETGALDSQVLPLTFLALL